MDIPNPDYLLIWYHEYVSRGPDYFRSHHRTTGDPDRIEFGDLAWAVLLEGRPSSRAAQSLLRFTATDAASLGGVPTLPLHEQSADQRRAVAEKVIELMGLPGLLASVATKTVHPKRRHAVPVLDNRAIFGTLINPAWAPGSPILSKLPKHATVHEAVDAIFASVADPASQEEWEQLERQWNPLTRIEIFDMCWWAVIHGIA